MNKQYKRILIANRGDSAVRVIRACKEMGIETVSIYSKADKGSLHSRIADISVCIGDVRSKDSYLNSYNILAIAIYYKVDAIHPGIGYFAENADFSELCEKCGIDFIGPGSNVIRLMGNKIEAKKIAKGCAVPVIGDNSIEVADYKDCIAYANEIGYPVILKASNGGGGKGIRVAACELDIPHLFETCQREAEQVFGKSNILIEKYIEKGKHVEVQILADKYGNVIHIGDRECSIQRKNQKLIEEAKCNILTKKVRDSMYQCAIDICTQIGYAGLGTIEYILDADNSFYFMEMNTRLQVEHTISEMVSGIDLVKEQIRVAQGERLQYKQEDIKLNGYAIQCRILSEYYNGNFVADHGKITNFHAPGGLGVRVDTSYEMDNMVTTYYDSLLCKISCHDIDKSQALKKMIRCLEELRIEGVSNNREILITILKDSRFLEGDYTTTFFDTEIDGLMERYSAMR
jgi:acetyl-CoA carboxylase biotin carboxylase subunit